MANAKQIDFILQNRFYGNSASTNYNGLALDAGYLLFKTVGGGSNKTVWKDALKASSWDSGGNKVTLDSNGHATDEVYADGTYDIEVYDQDDTLIETIGNVKYTTTTTVALSRVTTSASTYTVVSVGISLEANSVSNNITISLITAVGNEGEVIEIIKTSASNVVTIDPDGSETVNGATTMKLISLNDYVLLRSDGTNWKIFSETAGVNSSYVRAFALTLI